jgi:hypothetical protein
VCADEIVRTRWIAGPHGLEYGFESMLSLLGGRGTCQPHTTIALYITINTTALHITINMTALYGLSTRQPCMSLSPRQPCVVAIAINTTTLYITIDTTAVYICINKHSSPAYHYRHDSPGCTPAEAAWVRGRFGPHGSTCMEAR